MFVPLVPQVSHCECLLLLFSRCSPRLRLSDIFSGVNIAIVVAHIMCHSPPRQLQSASRHFRTTPSWCYPSMCDGNSFPSHNRTWTTLSEPAIPVNPFWSHSSGNLLFLQLLNTHARKLLLNIFHTHNRISDFGSFVLYDVVCAYYST
jgi:hypothetical protein